MMASGSDVLDHIDVVTSSVASLQNLFDCPICLDMLKDPVRTTSCGHTFCRMCIKQVLRKLTKEPCPICKTLLTNRNIVEDQKMSVFLGLLIELISAMNADLGFDVTAYYTKPTSSYEASMSSEEFVNMKSNTIESNKMQNGDEKDIDNTKSNDTFAQVGDFPFVKPKSATKTLKRKLASNNDVEKISKVITTIKDNETEKQVVENKTKKLKTSSEVEERERMEIEGKEREKIMVDNGKKKRQRLEGKGKDASMKMNLDLEPGPMEKPVEINDSNPLVGVNKKSTTSTKTSTSNKTRTIFKKAVNPSKRSKMNKIDGGVSPKSMKVAGNSSFAPKRLNTKTSKFYFTTSLMMRRDGHKPMTIMKRTYPVSTKFGPSKSDGEKSSKCSKIISDSSDRESDSNTRKPCTVSVKTSPMKFKTSMRQSRVKQHTSTKTGVEVENFAEKAVKNDYLESPKTLKLRNSTVVCEKEIENDCLTDVPSDRSNQGKKCATNVSQEDMDIFESLEAESDKLKLNSIEVDQMIADTELTQQNPNIQNRNNVCTSRIVTPRTARMRSLIKKSENENCESFRNESPSESDVVPAATTQPKPDLERGVSKDDINFLEVGVEEKSGTVLLEKSPVNKTPSRRRPRETNQRSEKSFLEDSRTSPKMEKDSKEQLSIKADPLIIDESDDEIPETPTKIQKSEILTQHMNNSKLDKSISENEKSIIPSSLEISLRSSSSSTLRKYKKSPTGQLVQKKSVTQRSSSASTTGQMLHKKVVTFSETGNWNTKGNKKYSFTYSRLDDPLLEKLEVFAEKINAGLEKNITEDTTHVIIVPKQNNRAPHTFKFLKGIAKKLWVVSISWILRSLEAKKILPEENFLLLDESGEPGPWRCKNLTTLPLSAFTVVTVPQYDSLEHEQVKELLVLSGAKVVEDMSLLAENPKVDRPRVLLLDDDTLDEKIFENLLNVRCVVPLRLGWLFASIGQYRPATVSKHLPFPADAKTLLSLGLTDDLMLDSESDEEEA